MKAYAKVPTQLATELIDFTVDVILASIARAASAARRIVHTVPMLWIAGNQ